MKLNVLMLSLDTAILGQSTQGDTLKRFRDYAKASSSFAVVIPSDQTQPLVHQRFTIYPTGGTSHTFQYLRLPLLINRLHHKQPFNLLVTNNLVLTAIASLTRTVCRLDYSINTNVFGLEHTSPAWLKERPQNTLFKWLQDWAVTQSDTIRTDNSTARKLLLNHYRLSPDRVLAIPIAPTKTEQQRFLTAKKSSTLKRQIAGTNKLVLSVGNLVKAKDYPNLVQAIPLVLNNHPRTTFAIAGQGPQKRHLTKLIRQQRVGDRVKLLGSVSYSKLPSLYASADLFALSSSHEGLPRVIMEAALTARPIVATKVFGVTDLLTHKHSGLLVPTADPPRLARAISHLLDHPSTAKKYARSARQKAIIHLDYQSSLHQLTNLWKTTIST